MLLMRHLQNAHVDGLDARKYRTRDIQRALQAAWGGNPRAVHKAELLLAQGFVDYANDLKRRPSTSVYYVDPQLMPRGRSPTQWLADAAAAPSIERYAATMGWMNPIYGQLREVLIQGAYEDEKQRGLLHLNLERARALPSGNDRYIVVNAAAQRLFAYERGEVVDTMRVVVGKPKNATPMMAAIIRFASLNPYWHVPPDLAAERIAPNVVKDGLRYLKSRGYEVLSDWGDNASVVDPITVDWKAVAEGRSEVRVRQLPGPHNAMGQMKFMFPNREGIYLHDTPEKQLLTEASRLFSGGCVRLEDADRLGRWLFGRALQPEGSAPEQRVDLMRPVPVFITYLTAVPSGSAVAWYDDIYGRDAARLAEGGGTPAAATR
jgi:murein L,D-transpeptidase YcbB/YkuD